MVHPMKTPIETSRLALRPARMEDAAALFRLFNNWNVIRWLGPPPWPYALADMTEFISTVVPRADAAPTFLVIEKAREPIGAVSWTPREGDARPYLGYWLGEPHWNKGYMTEAVARVLDGLFGDGRTDAVASGIFVGNEGSLAVQKKLGFAVLGESSVRSRPLGKYVVHLDTLLTRARYLELRT
jgi:8-oxo-dGTP diphosphatase